jgi:hypothetical protein
LTLFIGTAAEFVKRTVNETSRWLDRVEELASAGELDTDKLGKLIAAWRAATEAGRQAFALDTPAPRVAINIKAPQTAQEWSQLAAERAGRPPRPNDWAIPLRIERVERPVLTTSTTAATGQRTE